MDRLTAMKVFRNVAELGSFAEASRHMDLSPAAVSKNISELESHLGVQLFNRTTRRLSRTEAGSQYYEYVVRILDEVEEAETSIGSMQHAPRGLLRVTAPLTLSLTLLSSRMSLFLERHPHLSLDLRLDDRRIDIVREGYDVAIRVSANLDDSSLIAKKLANLQHVVCGAPSYLERFGAPTRPEDLKHHNCLKFTLTDHVDEWEFRNATQTIRVPITGRYRVTSSLAVRDALIAGFGLSLIPRVYVASQIGNGDLRTVLNDWTTTETIIYALYPSKKNLSAKVRAFLDFVGEQLSS